LHASQIRSVAHGSDVHASSLAETGASEHASGLTQEHSTEQEIIA
jgi:hypothetical protein